MENKLKTYRETEMEQKLPWQAKTLYTVETPEGDLLTLTPDALRAYARRQGSKERQEKTER